MNLLLDTNAYTALMKGDTSVSNKVRDAEGVFMSAIVVGELIFGFKNGSRFSNNMEDLERFVSSSYVRFLPIDFNTTLRFGLIAASLKKRGTPIPSNDIWIAAQAINTGAALVSFDSHFNRVDDIWCIIP